MADHYGTQSDEGNDASDYILKNVYDEWNQEDGHVQSETTYDTLINEYVDIETEKEKLEVDLEHKKKAACRIYMTALNRMI